VSGSGVAADGSWLPEFAGQRKPFERGNVSAVRHGAFSHRLTGELAEQIRADQLARTDCPLWLRDDSYALAVTAWSFAEARCLKIRRRMDELERMEGEDAALAEITETTEDEHRPAPGVMNRVTRTRQMESLSRALDRAEGRAKGLRQDLGLTPASRAKLGRDITNTGRLDLALFYAELAERDEQAGGAG
jgi:hypothetical protein